MFEFLKRLWPGRGTAAPVAPAPEAAESLPEGAVWKTPHGAAFDMDSFSAGSRAKLCEVLAEQNDLPVFGGEIRHAYSKVRARGLRGRRAAAATAR